MELKGKTLKVYLYLLKKNEAGVREIQRKLKFNSPSLAQYHLKRLEEMGLVYENKGRYYISKNIKPEILRDFIKLGFILIPKIFLIGIFYSIISIYFLYKFLMNNLTFIDINFLIFIPILISIIILIEGIRAYKKLLIK